MKYATFGIILAVVVCNAQASLLYVNADYQSQLGATINIHEDEPFLDSVINAGAYNFSVTPGSGATATNYFTPGQTYYSYCIDVGQKVRWTDTWQVVDVSEAPNPFLYSHGKINADEQQALGKLYGMYYQDSLTSREKSAAFQAAIWEIVDETDSTYNVETGTFTAQSSQTGTLNTALANSMLDNSENYTGPMPTLVALTGAGNTCNIQDQLVCLDLNLPPMMDRDNAVPEPLTAFCSIVSLSGLGAYLRRRVAGASIS